VLKLRVKQTADHLAAFTPEEKWQFISLLVKELELLEGEWETLIRNQNFC